MPYQTGGGTVYPRCHRYWHFCGHGGRHGTAGRLNDELDLWIYFLPCLWAFLACAGFWVMLNVRTGVIYCCIGGALGWLVYLLAYLVCDRDLLSYFLAAMAISAYSEFMARIRKCPVTSYLLISFFPMVSGAGICYTMEYTLRCDMPMCPATGLHTLGIAGYLALGVLVVSSTVRMVITFKRHRKNPRSPLPDQPVKHRKPPIQS